MADLNSIYKDEDDKSNLYSGGSTNESHKK